VPQGKRPDRPESKVTHDLPTLSCNNADARSPSPSRASLEILMSKGQDKKKETKKKPQKTLAEKRAAKQEKKRSRG
jgi:hypothetical protein